MLKIFADECINYDTVLALRNRNINVLTVREAGLTGTDDETIFNFAVEKERVLLTFDRGFGDIFRFNISKSAGVIVVLVNQMSKNEVANILLNFIDFFKNGSFGGKLVIIGKTKIRIQER